MDIRFHFHVLTLRASYQAVVVHRLESYEDFQLHCCYESCDEILVAVVDDVRHPQGSENVTTDLHIVTLNVSAHLDHRLFLVQMALERDSGHLVCVDYL